MKNIFIFSGFVIICYAIITFGTGCAQVGVPTGGAKDTLAPVLVRADPENEKLNFAGNKVTLVFDEYIEVKDLQSNLLVSPFPKNNPVILSNLKTISIKFKDTLQPNTTYSVNFGNAIADVHEGNIIKNFTYTFSTGSTIDSMELGGRVMLAETGKPDTTILVLLYKDAPDTAVTARKPDYITKLNGEGTIKFSHLPVADLRIYSKTETFAFIDTTVSTSAANSPVMMFAYAEQKEIPRQPATPAKRPAEKKLKYSTSISAKTQDLLQPLQIIFNNGLKTFDSSKLVVCDTNFKPLPGIIPLLDSTRSKVSININWQPETEYYFILPKEAFGDSAGNLLEKSDTVRFATKKISDYGTVLLRFKNIDLAKHPVIQFLQADVIKFSYPIMAEEWSNNRFTPGEYDVRILYDLNNNGVWDPGNFKDKLQPEHSILLPQKLAIKADWDNEREIQL